MAWNWHHSFFLFLFFFHLLCAQMEKTGRHNFLRKLTVYPFLLERLTFYSEGYFHWIFQNALNILTVASIRTHWICSWKLIWVEKIGFSSYKFTHWIYLHLCLPQQILKGLRDREVQVYADVLQIIHSLHLFLRSLFEGEKSKDWKGAGKKDSRGKEPKPRTLKIVQKTSFTKTNEWKRKQNREINRNENQNDYFNFVGGRFSFMLLFEYSRIRILVSLVIFSERTVQILNGFC